MTFREQYILIILDLEEELDIIFETTFLNESLSPE